MSEREREQCARNLAPNLRRRVVDGGGDDDDDEDAHKAEMTQLEDDEEFEDEEEEEKRSINGDNSEKRGRYNLETILCIERMWQSDARLSLKARHHHTSLHLNDDEAGLTANEALRIWARASYTSSSYAMDEMNE